MIDKLFSHTVVMRHHEKLFMTGDIKGYGLSVCDLHLRAGDGTRNKRQLIIQDPVPGLSPMTDQGMMIKLGQVGKPGIEMVLKRLDRFRFQIIDIKTL
ncbi:MAG: hypothetical protein DRH93_17345 [Deltaproteobacteria bacterium]|nr:MAG: hypothetical protein DRH93_17345 [Deltaproteobacteria bacterium]